MSLMKDASRWGVEEIERAARQVLDRGLGDGASSIEPDQRAWSPGVAADLRHRIIDNADMGKGTFLSKLEVQLAGAARPTFLLAAELLFVHAAPLSNIGPATKRDRIRTVLSWLDPAPEIPAPMELALATAGVFNGGTGFNVGIWRQVGWLLAFVEHWWGQRDSVRTSALADPWRFRDVVESMPRDQPAIRNSLLYLAFPRVFFPIVNQQHKNAIRDAFVSSIGTSSGDDLVAVDRDLVAIRERQLKEAQGAPANYYFEPYLSQWWKQSGGPDVQRAWLVRPRQGGRELVQQWLADGFVSLQGEHLGAVAQHPDRQTVLSQVYADYQHLDYAQRVTLANEFHAFLSRMRPDDIVVTAMNGQVWIGTLEDDPTYEANEPSTRLRRTVTWEPDSHRLSELDDVAADSLDKQGTVVELTDTLPVWEDLGGDVAPEPVPDRVVVPPSRDAATLAASLHLPQAWLTELIDLLLERRQVILYGPPGTGKTYVADAVARHIAQDGTRLVQFHPSYSYEDFFEGFRPSMADGQVGFRLAPGPLRLIAASAVLHPELPHVLIIDEINRANIAKVFGELYYLLEYRNKSIQLQYSPEEEFVLPPNLSIIGTMNTADKSIAVMDAAIRRRFAFVELHPDTEPVRDLLRDWLTSQGKAGDERVLLLRALNDALGEQEHDFKIGPSYLMTAEAERPGGLERIWKHSILPLLHEHFYGRPEGWQVEERFGLDALRKGLSAVTLAP